MLWNDLNIVLLVVFSLNHTITELLSLCLLVFVHAPRFQITMTSQQSSHRKYFFSSPYKFLLVKTELKILCFGHS